MADTNLALVPLHNNCLIVVELEVEVGHGCLNGLVEVELYDDLVEEVEVVVGL
jgi:hypothetical protein